MTPKNTICHWFDGDAHEAARFYEVFKDQPQSLENVLAMLFNVATSDGRLKMSEESMIRSAALLFNFPEASYVQLRRRFVAGDSSGGGGSSGKGAYTGGYGASGGNGASKDSSYEILGCSPSDKFQPGPQPSLPDDWVGGFLCPCHGSTFDLAGRVFKNKPAPDNLEVPPYMYLSDSKLLIGEDKKA